MAGLRQQLQDALHVMHAQGEPQVFPAAELSPTSSVAGEALSYGDAPPPLSPHAGSPQVVFVQDSDTPGPGATGPASAPGPEPGSGLDPDPYQGPGRADVLFTEAMRAQMAREAVGAPEDVGAPLAASVLGECKWQQQVLSAQLEQYVATERQRHATSQQLMGHLVAALTADVQRHRDQAKALWGRLHRPLQERLRTDDLPALAHHVTTVTSDITAATLLDQVATQAADLMARWPALAALHYTLQRVQHLGAALREAQVELAALGYTHEQRVQQAQEEAHRRAQATVQACKRRLQRLGQTQVPAEGTRDLQPAALGGRHAATQTRAQSLAAASTAATLVRQKEAARLALQTRIAYELHLLEKNVSGT
jgi:hypothetical protein